MPLFPKSPTNDNHLVARTDGGGGGVAGDDVLPNPNRKPRGSKVII